jgi:hypothetical protein
VELKLAPGAVITVLVLDENGDPVERAMVQAGVYRFLSGRRIFTNSSANSTNDLGEARISGIAGGTYFLSASAPLLAMQGMVPARKPGQNYDESLALTFYPGVTQREQALPVQVGSGQETQVTLRMQKGRTYRVRGELPTAASDSPRSQVMLFPLRDPMDLAGMNSAMRTIMPKADGKFEVAGVLPGRYQLVVGRGGSSPFQNPAASALVEVRDGDVDGVMPQPVRPVTIRGRVRFEGDDQTGVAGLRVVLQSVEGMPTALNTGNPPVTAADGTFIVEGLMPGRYQIRTLGAPSAPGTYLKAIRLGTTDATSTPLDLTADNPPAIEIVYSRKAAKVEATVSRIDDKRPWGVALLVPDPWVPDPMALNGVPRLSTVAQGVATWTNVPPGKYRAYAIEQAELLMAIDPEILSKLESRGAAINVGEGETARATVKQIAPEELERQ